MKQGYLKNKINFEVLKFCFGLLLCCSLQIANGQIPNIRSYATRQHDFSGGVGLLGSTTNLANAVDADPSTSSNLTLGIGIGPWREQVLDFNTSSSTAAYTEVITAGTPITVKFTLPAGLAGALNRIEIQAVTNLRLTNAVFQTWDYDTVGITYTGSSLIGLASGAGTMEYTITPTADFQGIRIRVSGLASVAIGIDIYDAYIKVPASANIICNQAIDELHGIRAGIVVGGLANATGGVVNALNVIDGDTGTYAEVNTGAQVLSEIYLTSLFNTPSKIGDSIILLIQDPGAGLLDLSLLGGVTINLYNGSNGAAVQTVSNSSTLLNLSLLNSNASNIAKLAFVPTVIFDRAEIAFTGIVSALTNLRVYEIYRKNASAALTAAQANLNVYAGNIAMLNASSIALGDSVEFYDAPIGGNLVGNSIATTTTQMGTVLSFYATVARNGCSGNTDRKQIDVHVIGVNNQSLAEGTISVPYNGNGSVAITSGANALPLAPGFKYTSVSIFPAGLTLESATGIISGTPTESGTFPVTINVIDTANNLVVGAFDYNIIISSSPLAIKFMAFSGRAEGHAAVLNWKIASIEGIVSFVIQRSRDGYNFEKIGSTPVATIVDELKYSFKDTKPFTGLNYYRLYIFEKSGNCIYSNVAVVNIGDENIEITLAPNPANNEITINSKNELSRIFIFNTIGQKMEVPITSGAGFCKLNTSGLPSGIYTLRMQSGNEFKTSQFVLIH
jgi:hypothetical protein